MKSKITLVAPSPFYSCVYFHTPLALAANSAHTAPSWRSFHAQTCFLSVSLPQLYEHTVFVRPNSKPVRWTIWCFPFPTLPKRPRSGRRRTFEPILLWTQCIVKVHLGFPLQTNWPDWWLFFCFLLGCRRFASPATDLTSTSKYSRARVRLAWEFLFTLLAAIHVLWTCLLLKSQEAGLWWEWRQDRSPREKLDE